MSSLAALSVLGAADADRGFRADARFGSAGAQKAPAELPAELPDDPLSAAWTEGYAEGVRHARAEAEAAQAAEAEARTALDLSLTRLDAAMAEDLRQRLHDTVLALCDAALVPLALDHEALAARTERAVAMFARADDQRVIRLHPDDLALVSPRLPAEWRIEPDPALERGTLRVESQTGGVEDGPAQWRQALAEAFRSC